MAPPKKNETIQLDPADYGLPPRTALFKRGAAIVIYIDRKSRIIMKDGQKILEKAEKIEKAAPKTKIVVETTAPVCSKTARLLKENSIEIKPA